MRERVKNVIKVLFKNRYERNISELKDWGMIER